MRKRILLTVLVLFLINAYLVFAPRPLSTELAVERAWATEVGAGGGLPAAAESGSTEDADAAAAPVPFRLGESFGYIDRNSGRLLTRETVLYDVVYGQESYVNFSAVSQTAVIRSNDGRIQASIQASGYPYMTQGRLFLIHPEGTTLSEWSLSGEPLWERSLPAVITSLAATEGRAVVGLADGSVRLIDADGGIVDTYRDPAARLPIVLGVAAGSDSSSMAVISGIDPQQAIVFEPAEDQLVPERQIELDSDFRRPVYAGYHFRDTVLAVEGEEGVLLQQLNGPAESMIPLQGRLTAIASEDQFGLLAAVGARTAETEADIRRYSMTIQLYPDRPLAHFDYRADASSLSARDGWLLIGVGDDILGIRLVRL